MPFNIVSSGGGVLLDGSLTVDGAAATASPTITVRSFDDGDEGDGPIYPSIIQTDSAVVTYDPGDGTFTASSDFAAEVDFLQVEVTFDEAPGVPYIRTFDVRGLTAPYALPHSTSTIPPTGSRSTRRV